MNPFTIAKDIKNIEKILKTCFRKIYSRRRFCKKWWNYL